MSVAPTPNGKIQRQFYRAKEAATLLGMNYQVFCRWCNSDDPRRPPNKKFNGGKSARIYVPIKPFHAWMEQGNP